MFTHFFPWNFRDAFTKDPGFHDMTVDEMLVIKSTVAPADILVKQLAACSPTVQPYSAYTLEPRHLVAAKNIMKSFQS